MEIYTFKCSQCNVDFYKEEGGICAQCNKPFCSDHLYEVKDNNEVIFLCDQHKGDKSGEKKRNPILMARRFFKPKQK